jgi:hypothetical protein
MSATDPNQTLRPAPWRQAVSLKHLLLFGSHAQIFNLAKKDVTGYEVYADQLAAMLKGNRELLRDVLDGLFHIAKADCCAPE